MIAVQTVWIAVSRRSAGLSWTAMDGFIAWPERQLVGG